MNKMFPALLIDQTPVSESTFESIAQLVPEAIARFKNQKVVFFHDLLMSVHMPETIHVLGEEGEVHAIDSVKVGLYALLSTNNSTWKLVKAGKDQLPEIDQARHIIRSVKSISTEKLEEGDQVFHSLEEALKDPLSVKILHLADQQLKQFPVEVFACKNLVNLNVGKNQLTELPADIKLFEHLEVLKLSRNQLTHLPDEVSALSSLKQLHVSRNKLVAIPATIGHLQQLELVNLGANQLKRLPDSFFTLDQLKELELADNLFSRIQRWKINQLLPGVDIEWE